MSEDRRQTLRAEDRAVLADEKRHTQRRALDRALLNLVDEFAALCDVARQYQQQLADVTQETLIYHRRLLEFQERVDVLDRTSAAAIARCEVLEERLGRLRTPDVVEN